MLAFAHKQEPRLQTRRTTLLFCLCSLSYIRIERTSSSVKSAVPLYLPSSLICVCLYHMSRNRDSVFLTIVYQLKWVTCQASAASYALVSQLHSYNSRFVSSLTSPLILYIRSNIVGQEVARFAHISNRLYCYYSYENTKPVTILKCIKQWKTHFLGESSALRMEQIMNRPEICVY